MKKVKIILMTPVRSIGVPILDRIEGLKLSCDTVQTTLPSLVLAEVPENSKCIIITDSYASHGPAETKTDGVKNLVSTCRKKNPECKIILHAADFWDLDEALFDFCVDTRNKDSLKLLFEKIEEYSKN